jgi:hypothetical protein
MGKIGRNDPCPCQSGKKYKHCCAKLPQQERKPMSAEEQMKVTLMSAVDKVIAAAEEKREEIIVLGVFVLYSTVDGDAWVFEVTETDCVQLMDKGEKLENPINENPETIEVEWKYMWAVKKKVMTLTAYDNKEVRILSSAPTKKIAASRKRVLRKFTPQQLKDVHLSSEKISD